MYILGLELAVFGGLITPVSSSTHVCLLISLDLNNSDSSQPAVLPQ